jgi:hypothetical protein
MPFIAHFQLSQVQWELRERTGILPDVIAMGILALLNLPISGIVLAGYAASLFTTRRSRSSKDEADNELIFQH